MRIGSRVLGAGALAVAALLIAGCSAGGAGSAGGGDSARGSSGIALNSGGGKPSAQPGAAGGGADQAAASVQLVDLGNRIVRKATLNLEVVESDPERNLLLVKGSVPGPNGGVVVVRNAVKAAVKGS